MIENIVDEKILVTGGTGFLGRYVVERLISDGFKPTVLTRNPQTKVFENAKGKLKLAAIDLLDSLSVKLFVENFRPDRIIHLAGYVYPTGEQPDILEKFNYQATANLLDSAARVNVKNFILTGTADEYGFQSAPQTETMAAMPVSNYAVSKNKAVEYALSVREVKGLPIVIVRPFTIYGIGQPARMFVSQAVNCAVRKMPFEMSQGRQKRDLLFVTDFVNAIIKLLAADNIAGEIFNVGSGETIALVNLAEKIWEIAGADADLLKVGARPTNENELHDTQADVSKITGTLDWKPAVSLDEGLRLVIEKAFKDLK